MSVLSKRNGHWFKLSVFSIWLTLSAFTKEVSGLGGAIYADLVGVVIVCAGLLELVRQPRAMSRLPTSVKLYFSWLIVVLIASIINYEMTEWIVEYIKLAFLFFLFISLYLIGIKLRPSELRDYCLVTASLFALLAIAFFVDFAMLPFLNNGSYGGLVGGFRNTGQAGTFFSLGLIFLLALIYSGSFQKRYIVYIMCTIVFVALLATSKRAALLGVLAAGGMLYIFGVGGNRSSFLKRTMIALILVTFSGAAFEYTSEWGVENIEGLEKRIERKFVSDFDGSSQSFLSDQVYKTLDIIEISPFFGAGASGSIGFLGSRHEIHNGFLKVVGISGLVGGVLFGFYWLTMLKEIYSSRRESVVRNYYGFVATVCPLFVGYSVAWLYTYPLRKREFWLLMAFIYVFIHFEKNQHKKGAA